MNLTLPAFLTFVYSPYRHTIAVPAYHTGTVR